MPPPPPPPIALFPPASAINLVSNTKLQNALNSACGRVTIGGKRPNFGLTIVDLASGSGERQRPRLSHMVAEHRALRREHAEGCVSLRGAHAA